MTASSNLDLVRSLYTAWERGDLSSNEWAHPEIEFVIADGPEPGRWTGLAGMAAYWRGFLSNWEQYRTEADEYRELGDGRVLVLARFSALGKTSGLEVGQLPTKMAALFTVGDGKVTRLVLFWDRKHAVADLDLVPEAYDPC